MPAFTSANHLCGCDTLTRSAVGQKKLRWTAPAATERVTGQAPGTEAQSVDSTVIIVRGLINCKKKKKNLEMYITDSISKTNFSVLSN